MITDEFFRWANGIKVLIEKRVGEHVVVWITERGSPYNIISIGIDCTNGMRFYMEFDQMEFDKNNYHQRRSLAKVRRENMVWTMRDHCVDISEIANKLH